MLNYVELEITLRCNRACLNCNRFCNRFKQTQFGPETDMSLEQVEQFCKEVEFRPLKTVRIVGGEPLLHPRLGDILDMLRGLIDRGSLRSVDLTTNGDRLSEIDPAHLDRVRVNVSHLKSNFYRTLCSPEATGQRRIKCNVPHRCGMALNVWGYWPCGPACAIAKLLGLNGYNLKHMPEELWEFGKLNSLRNLAICDYCQKSARRPIREGPNDELTEPFLSKLKQLGEL